MYFERGQNRAEPTPASHSTSDVTNLVEGHVPSVMSPRAVFPEARLLAHALRKVEQKQVKDGLSSFLGSSLYIIQGRERFL